MHLVVEGLTDGSDVSAPRLGSDVDELVELVVRAVEHVLVLVPPHVSEGDGVGQVEVSSFPSLVVLSRNRLRVVVSPEDPPAFSVGEETETWIGYFRVVCLRGPGTARGGTRA